MRFQPPNAGIERLARMTMLDGIFIVEWALAKQKRVHLLALRRYVVPLPKGAILKQHRNAGVVYCIATQQSLPIRRCWQNHERRLINDREMLARSRHLFRSITQCNAGNLSPQLAPMFPSETRPFRPESERLKHRECKISHRL